MDRDEARLLGGNEGGWQVVVSYTTFLFHQFLVRDCPQMKTLRSQKSGDERISREAVSLCLTLACCTCDQVPAFLFTRPYAPQPRWNAIGEIEQSSCRPRDFPSWPCDLFINHHEPLLSREHIHAAQLGLRPYNAQSHSKPTYRLSSDLQWLQKNSIIEMQEDEGWLYFTLDYSCREMLEAQLSTTLRMHIWLELLKLVSHAYPEAYVEPLSREVQHRCNDVIESTVLPFLSVMSGLELMEHGLQ